jgi:hypothetical protein
MINIIYLIYTKLNLNKISRTSQMIKTCSREGCAKPSKAYCFQQFIVYNIKEVVEKVWSQIRGQGKIQIAWI